MNNEQYLALGPLAQTQNINGVNVPITNAYEYQIDPKTKALTTNPVDRAPENQGFTDFLTTPAGALTAMAILGTGGLGINALAGEAALGGGAFEAMGPTYAELGYTPGAFTDASLGYTGAAQELGLEGSSSGLTDLSGNAGSAMLDSLGLNAGTALAGLTAADLLKYGVPLAKLLTGSGSGSGSGLSSVLGGLGGGATPTAAGGMTPYGTYAGYDSGITDLKPGLTKGSQFKFANEPTFASQQVQTPVSQQPIDYTQQIYNAATGGSVQHYADGDTVEKPEAPSPYLKAGFLKGQPFRPFGHAATAQFAGYRPREFAEGGTIPEGHDPQFFSEGGLNSLENTYVQGEGDGTSDSVAAMLADGEFVIPSDVVSDLGNGSNNAGAKVLQGLLATIREHKQNHDPKDLPPKSKGALAYLLDAKRKVG
jgi:hypothetical protein